MVLLLGFLLAMSVTMALIPPLMRAAGYWQVLDQPSDRKVHTTPVPRVGGIAMAAGMLLAVVLWGNFAQPMPSLLAGVVVLLVFGVWDDRVTLGAAPKFLGQAIAVLLVMLLGDVTIGTITLDARHSLPPWLAQPLTFMFLLGVTNAINLADGLDGLAGGTTLLSLGALALLAFTAGNTFVAPVAVFVTGAILGFLRFNTHPARVFMGDSGSQILGFSAGVLAVVLTQDPATPLSSALPLLLLGIPIIDTLMVMTQRMLQGRSPFHADRNHIHHRLLAFGLDHHEAVIIIYLLQASLFVLAWFMRFQSDLLIAAVFLLLALAVIALLETGRARAWRRGVAGQPAHKSAVRRAFDWLRAPDHIPRWSLWSIGALTTCYLASVAWRCTAPVADVRWLAAALGIALCMTLVTRWSATEPSWFGKGALYICAVLAVYLDYWAETEPSRWSQAVLFGGLVLAVALRFRLTSDRRFRITPLDILVVFAAAVIPNLPGSLAVPAGAGVSVGKLVVLFYGLETLFSSEGRSWRWASIGALGFLAACVLEIGARL